MGSAASRASALPAGASAGEGAKRASACAAPSVSARPARAVRPKRDSRAMRSSRSCVFAAVEMGDAGDVDPQAVIAVDVAVGSVAAAPAGQTQQRRAIAARIGRLRRQTWEGRARVGQRLADAHALLRRAHVDGGDGDAVRARLD